MKSGGMRPLENRPVGRPPAKSRPSGLKLLERLINFLMLNHLQASFLRITLLYNQSIGGMEQEIVSEISTLRPDYILSY